MTKDQELKKEFINKLEDMFEGAYQLDPGKILVIPYEGVELKLSFTVKKGGGSAAKDRVHTVLKKPTQKELDDLQDYLKEIF